MIPIKFNLTVNDRQQDGFKLSVQAEGEYEINMAKALTEKLIEKITKIEVAIGGDDEC